MEKYLKRVKNESWLLFFVLVISLIAHGINMFQYPAYREDEGTYMSQAWSFSTRGKLSPYTYWYDHAPLGWILIALWNNLSGGFFTFGLTVNSGRVLMLILHLLSTFLLFKIAQKLSSGKTVAFIASLLFSLSPLAIFFQRLVLLDNIMVFWLLFSLFFLTKDLNLRSFLLSSLGFSFAVLTKETAIVFFPVLVMAVFLNAHKNNKSFAVTLWLTVAFLIISLYPLFALIKGEFFPKNSLLGGTQPHVSLLETLKWQAEREGEGNFLNPQSSVRKTLDEWLKYDPLIIFLGTLSVFTNLSFFRKKEAKLTALLGLSFLLFLLRGGKVLDWYIIPLIPFFCLNIGFFVEESEGALRKIPKLGRNLRFLPAIIIVLVYLFYPVLKTPFIFTSNQTKNQVMALTWLKENVDQDSFVLIDNYGYVDLNSKPLTSFNLSPKAHYYWKVEKDPEIRNRLLNNDWQLIDYLLVTPALKTTIREEKLDFINQALINSELIVNFDSFMTPAEFYPVEIRKVNSRRNILEVDKRNILEVSWDWYKKRFVNEGRTLDFSSDQKTTSEGQSYSLLRAVWINDQEIFDKVLTWTFDHLKLPDKNLFAWLYGRKTDGTFGIKDESTATDADQDIALSLLLAYKKWGNPDYLELAKDIIKDIWQYETSEIGGKRYVVAGDWVLKTKNTFYIINPSYLSPYAYRLFVQVNKDHDWNGLVETSYQILDQCSLSTLGPKESADIPPDWCALDKDGQITSAAQIYPNASDYSYDALRVLWRIALDYQWFKEQKAIAFLEKMKFWLNEWSQNQKIYASYTHEGKAKEKTESLANYGAQLALFSIVDRNIARQIYDKKILPYFQLDQENAYWGEKNNYYDQNWVWFGLGLYGHRLPNLWEKE